MVARRSAAATGAASPGTDPSTGFIYRLPLLPSRLSLSSPLPPLLFSFKFRIIEIYLNGGARNCAVICSSLLGRFLG